MYQMMRMDITSGVVTAMNVFDNLDDALRQVEIRNRCPNINGRYFVIHQDELPMYHNKNGYLAKYNTLLI